MDLVSTAHVQSSAIDQAIARSDEEFRQELAQRDDLVGQ